MPKAKSSVEIKNRRASFDYEFIETFQAGIVLTGTEIKSIRAGKASLVDTFCYFNSNELYVKNMHIAEYWWGSWGKHDPRRDRKLLLTRKELNKLQRAVKEKGLTIVGVKLYIADNGYAKILIALALAATENEAARVAYAKLPELAGLEVHSSVILSKVDVGVFRKLGVNLTCEPAYQSKKLYHT